MPNPPLLKKIRTGALSRGLSLAKLSARAGASVASHAVSGVFSSEEKRAENLKALLCRQAGLLSRELGQLKGSLMKVGQILSMYGEQFLPAEANELLKSLQSHSPPLAWPAIETQLKRQLGEASLESIEIEREPLASASLGQVHRARRKSDGRWLAVKIQYPGVDRAVDSDLRALRSLLSVSKLIPRGPRCDELFAEVRSMLRQEVDYARELEATRFFADRLAGDPRYVVPEPVPELSTARILTTTFEEGLPVDSAEVLALPQERRNAIASAALDIYFRELFEFHRVQTDPHFGNYRVRLAGSGDRLVLLDFGAVRKVPESFLRPYRKMVGAALQGDGSGIIEASGEMGFLRPEDDPELKRRFTDLCLLICEPFQGGAYDFGSSDLPKRVARQAARMVVSFNLGKLRVPPREVVFLDRKMGGVFIFLQVLRAKLDARASLERYLS